MSLKHKSAFLFLPLLAVMILKQNASAENAATKAATATAAPVATPATVAAAPIAKSKTAAPAVAVAPVAKNNTAAPAAVTAAPASDKASAPASSGKKTCDDVKSEIEAKLKAKGVKAFTLDILPKADVKEAKVVGSCEAGSKKITYKRG